MNTIENLRIEATKQMPEVNFDVNGNLSISGRAIPDNAVPFFEVLKSWIDKLDCSEIIFDINLEYMNTSASMQLFSLLMLLEEKSSVTKVTVNWHYEEDDEDHYDTGLLFEEKLDRTQFCYQVEAA